MRSFSPAMQPDEIVLARALMRLTKNGTVPFDQAVADLAKQNLPPPLTQTAFLALLPGRGTNSFGPPQLLIPKNPRRKSIVIAYTGSNAVLFSYGRPPISPAAGGSLFGGRLTARSFHAASGGAMCTDDIWAMSISIGGTEFVTGYEGTLAVH